MTNEINDFIQEIEELESFFYELKNHKSEIAINGIEYVLSDLSTPRIEELLENFSINIVKAIRIAEFSDKTILERIQSMLNSTDIESIITQLTIHIKLYKTKKPLLERMLSTYSYMFSMVFGILKNNFSFSIIKGVHLEKILESLFRLKTILKLLNNEYTKYQKYENDVFNPQNININFVANEIDSAINHINLTSTINSNEKEELINYLKETKLELSKEKPKWNKIVGALVICAAILSGIADAPQAIDNINNAAKHILGTSIENSIPNKLPRLQPSSKKTESNNDEKDIIV